MANEYVSAPKNSRDLAHNCISTLLLASSDNHLPNSIRQRRIDRTVLSVCTFLSSPFAAAAVDLLPFQLSRALAVVR